MLGPVHDKRESHANRPVRWSCPDLLKVGAPLPRRTAVPQHRRHQIRTLPQRPDACVDRRFFLSGLRHIYDDVRCAQFGLWRGARRAHPRPGAVTDEQRSHRPNSAQPGGRQVFFAQTLLLAPHRCTAGYARRSRLVWAKNPLPRTSSYLCLRPRSDDAAKKTADRRK